MWKIKGVKYDFSVSNGWVHKSQAPEHHGD